ncbi:MAG: 3-phosphoshikimate 1-carboxyvinyltransferase [Clostridiales bacterium]|nr:3-phosphoshikimate 1-carboxyvinyltransferase [Clostridiales bacterium]
MFYLVNPTSALNGDVRIPGSKSQTARGLVLGTLAKGTSHILNPMLNLDNYDIAECCRRLGADVDTSNDEEWVVTSPGLEGLHIPSAILDVGNSGTGFYFITTLAAMLKGKSIVSGDYQICYRPIAPLLDAIREMGGKAVSTRDNELAPLMVEGPVEGGHAVHLNGKNVQWAIGLMVCCPALKDSTTIVFDTTLGERPYANLTMDWMAAAGVHLENYNYERFVIPGNQTYRPFTKRTACDWCSASYPMVAAAIMKEKCRIRLLGMDINDFMGERHYVEWINEMGGHVEVLNGGKDGIIVEGGHELHGIEIDCGDTPDAVPALAVLGCYAKGKMVLTNIAACRMKETDRAKTIAGELRKMGAHIEEGEDSLTIYHSPLHGATIDGHQDHRIVMATTCAALGAEGSSFIDSVKHVGVSFPRFYEEMTGIGANVKRLTEN